MGMTSLKIVERAIYSASVVDIAVMVCILEANVMGAPAKCTSQTDRDLGVIGSTWASHFRQLPAKSSSTQQSNCQMSLRADDQSLVSSVQEVTTDPLYCFGVAFSWVLRKAGALMHADGKLGHVDFSSKFNLPMMLR